MDMDLTTTPGMEPPAGHIPQFDGQYNYLQIGTIIAFAITYFFATLFVSLRYFQAFKLTQKVELDLGIVAGIRSVPFHFWTLILDSDHHCLVWRRPRLLRHHARPVQERLGQAHVGR
jgi:hypothetical protein